MKIALKNLRICSGFQILNQSKSYNLNASLMFSIVVILVDFYAKGQLLIIYSAFVKYLRKKMGIQQSSASALYRLQEGL